MNLRRNEFRKKFCKVALALLVTLLWGKSAGVAHQVDTKPQVSEGINWDQRIDKLLKVSKEGDIILTAVGDMIYNEEITHFAEPYYKNLYRILQDARISYGNLEMSLNEKAELQRGTYQFRMGRDFAWEIVRLGINLVSLANNHAFDYGPEGLKDCMRILRQSGISYAGGGLNLAQARAGTRMQVLKTRFALLSFYVPGRSANPDEPSISTIESPRVLIKKEDGSIESTIAASEADVKSMEDAIVLAKRSADIVIVHFHIHDVSHSRAYGIPNLVTPIHSLLAHKAVDAGADILINNGPHVLRAIEIYKGKPIFYSLSNFIYHWKTPEKIPPIIFERNDETFTGVVGSDPSLRGVDVQEESETVVARLTIRENKVNSIELIPVTIDDRGPHMGDPRLANDKRGKEIIEVLQKLSLPYKTKISYKDWYGTVEY